MEWNGSDGLSPVMTGYRDGAVSYKHALNRNNHTAGCNKHTALYKKHRVRNVRVFIIERTEVNAGPVISIATRISFVPGYPAIAPDPELNPDPRIGFRARSIRGSMLRGRGSIAILQYLPAMISGGLSVHN